MAYLGNSPVLSQQEYRNIDNISGSFNGVTTSFALLVNGVAPVPAPQSSNQCLISVNGVVQKPDDTGATGFRLSGGNIIFSSAPTGGQSFFGVILAGADYIYAGQNFPDGTVSAPSITFNQDLDTGFFRSGAGEIKYTANGTAVVTLSSNNLTAPSFIPTSSSAPTNGVYLPAANTVAISTGGSGRLFVNSSGYTSIGNSSPQALVHFGAGTSAPAFGTPSSLVYVCTAGQTEVQLRTTVNDVTGSIYTDSNGVNVRAASAHPLSFHTSNTERLRITSAGLVGIGSSSPVATNHIRGTGTSGQVTASWMLENGSSGTAGMDITGAAGSSIWRFLFGGGPSTGTNTLTPALTIGLEGSAAGRVGIGTTSPVQPLEVITASGGGIALRPSTSNATQGLLFYDTASGPWGFVKYDHQLSALSFGTVTSERARIDSSGRLLVGTSSSGSNSRVVIQGSSASSANEGILRLANGSATPANGVALGFLAFTDSNHSQAAAVYAERDGGTWTSGSSHPSRLGFSTTADGASSPTERMRINNNGYLKVSNSGNYQAPTASYHEVISSANETDIRFIATNTSYTDQVIVTGCYRSANSGYSLASFYSGDGSSNPFSDREFQFRGDGSGFCDGSWTGGGADYAEYFEWSDSNPDEEDRRGISVVLDGDKIRKAVTGEDPIGVISGNPSVVGDAAWNKWSGKYLRDEFGTYLLDENGERQLNPAFDPDAKYIPREQRPEWDCVGLMGKLRIRKGQVTGPRWIKMRDISDTVEEWLVR